MTTIARSAGRGRQTGEVEALRDLREEFTANRAEEYAFADRVSVGAGRIVAAAAAGSRMVVVNEAGKLGYLAGRRLRQLEAAK